MKCAHSIVKQEEHYLIQHMHVMITIVRPMEPCTGYIMPKRGRSEHMVKSEIGTKLEFWPMMHTYVVSRMHDDESQ